MRTILFAALFTCALPAPAHAQEPRNTSIPPQDYVGQYDLPDGRVLDVTQRARRLVAQVEGQEAVALTPSGPATFVAHKGGQVVTFDQRRNGNVTGMTLVTPAGTAGKTATKP